MNTENKSFTPPSIKDCWQTPIALFDNLNKEFNFTHDAACGKDNDLCGNNWLDGVRGSYVYGNSLNIDWCFSNWCNPPYSNIMPWVEKAIEEHQKGKTIVMLIPADTSVKWFKMAWESCNEARFISGRLSFVNAETQKPVNGNNKGSVLFVWRAHAPKGRNVILVDRDDLLK